MLEIIPDPIHVALLTAPFLVAFVGANFILWQPLMAYLEGREDTVAKAVKESEELEASAGQKLETLEASLKKAHAKVVELHAAARTRATGQEATILAAARADAEVKVSAAVESIASAQKAAASALESTATELSRDIASQILGRDVA